MSAIELKPFHNEAEVAIGDGFILRLVIDFSVVDRLEGLIGKPLDEVLGRLNTSTATMGKFLWAMTRPHHPDLSLDQVAGLLFSKEHGPAVVATLGNLVRTAFNIGEPDPEGKKGSRPPRRSGGASRGSSRNGSRQASGRTTSGRKRRAAS
jgi:hypothetical protein